MGFSAIYRTQEAKNSPRARFSGYDSNSSGGLSSRFSGPQSTPIEPSADQTLVELLLHAPVEPVGAVCGPPGPKESSHGPPPGQNLHQAARQVTPLLVLRLPPKHRHRRRRRGNKRHIATS